MVDVVGDGLVLVFVGEFFCVCGWFWMWCVVCVVFYCDCWYGDCGFGCEMLFDVVVLCFVFCEFELLVIVVDYDGYVIGILE